LGKKGKKHDHEEVLYQRGETQCEERPCRKRGRFRGEKENPSRNKLKHLRGWVLGAGDVSRM